jgi:aspartate/methionine/tyrosine aminotransferase
LNKPYESVYLELQTKYLSMYRPENISEENLLITAGARLVLMATFANLIKDDMKSTLLIQQPNWGGYKGMIASLGGQVDYIKLKENTTYPDFNNIEKQITTQVKAILITNPAAFDGTLIRSEDINTLLEICRKKNIFLIVDEIYSFMSFKESKFQSIVNSLDNNYANVVVINSISKTYNMANYRIGFMIAEETFLDKIKLIIEWLGIKPTHLCLAHSMYALEYLEEWKNDIISTRERNKIKVERLLEEAGIVYNKSSWGPISVFQNKNLIEIINKYNLPQKDTNLFDGNWDSKSWDLIAI